jgi:hypothetical protein
VRILVQDECQRRVTAEMDSSGGSATVTADCLYFEEKLRQKGTEFF